MHPPFDDAREGVDPSAADPRRPATLMLHLLGRCNLTCRHCYMEGAPERRERLRADAVVGAIGECPQLGVGALYLTGGEPLLYKDLERVLQTAALDPGLKITVCTNGTLVKPRHAQMLCAARAQASVSVDGDEAFHDRFRNLPGAFRRTERGIAALVAADVPVTVITTVSRGNLDTLPVLAEWAAEQGAAQLRVQPLLKLGRGEHIIGEALDATQMDRLLLTLSDLANRYRGRGLRCSLVGVTKRFLAAHPCGAYVCNGTGCHRRVEKEIKKLVVREDGRVLPEVTNLHPSFALGHIEDGPLATLVERWFANGHARFDRLCRRAYAEVLPRWEPAVVPWDQIVAERSHRLDERADALCEADLGCAVCAPRRSIPIVPAEIALQ